MVKSVEVIPNREEEIVQDESNPTLERWEMLIGSYYTYSDWMFPWGV